jgi:PAS domain S-box-containing protein
MNDTSASVSSGDAKTGVALMPRTVRGRLIYAFAGLSVLTVGTAILGLVSIREIDDGFSGIARDTVPAMAMALDLSKNVTALTTLAPSLSAATSESERNHNLEMVGQFGRDALTALGSLENRITTEETVGDARQDVDRLFAIIDRINELVIQRHSLELRSKSLARRVQDAHTRLAQAVAPLVNIATVDMTVRVEDVAGTADTDTMIRDINRGIAARTDILNQLFGASSVANLLVGVLSQAATLPDEDSVGAAETRAKRVGRNLLRRLRIGTYDETRELQLARQSAEDLLGLAAEEESVFALRRQQLANQDDEQQLLVRGRGLSVDLIGKVNGLVDQARRSTERTSASVAGVISERNWLLGAMAALSVFAALVIGWWYVAHSIGGRLAYAIRAMGSLAAGDHEIALPTTAGGDEFADLFGALAVFRDNARHMEVLRREQAVADEALRESEDRYARAMDAMNEAVWEWDLKTGTLVFSPSTRDLIGIGFERIQADAWAARIHPDDAEAFHNATRDHIKGETDRLVVEYRFRNDDDVWVWIRHVAKATHDDDGQVVRITGSGSNISEAKDAAVALEESQRQLGREREVLDATLEHMDQGIWVADKDLKVLAFNPRVRELYDLPSSMFTGEINYRDVIRYLADRGDYGDMSFDEVMATFFDPEVRNQLRTYEATLASGLVLQINNNPLPDGGFVRTYTDITARKQAEESLRQSEECHALAMRAAADTMFTWDPDKDIVTLTGRKDTFLGHDPAAITQREAREGIIHPDDLEGLRTAVIDHLNGRNERMDHVYRVRHSDGEYRTVRQHGLAQRDAEGRANLMAGSIDDITDQERLEQDLAQTSDLLRNTLDNVIQGVVMFDRDRRVMVWNRQYERTFEFEDGFVEAGKTNRELALHLADRGIFGEGDAETVTDARLDQIWSGETVRREMVVHGVNGMSTFDVLSQGTDEGGLVITYTDITERKRAEAAVRESEGRLMAFLDAATAPITMKDLDGRFLLVNQAMADNRGGVIDEIVGKTAFDIFPDELAQTLRNFDRQAFEAGDAVHFEAETVAANGDTAYFLATTFPVFDRDGAAIGTGTVSTDITDRRQVEEALRRSERQIRERLEGSPVGVLVVGVGDRVVFCNQSWRDLARVGDRPLEDIVLSDLLIDPADRGFVIDKLKTDGGFQDTELQYKRADGKPVWTLTSIQRTIFEGEEATISWFSDITESKQAQAALMRERAISQATMDNVDQGIYVVDGDNRIIAFNGRALDLMGVPEKEMSGEPPVEELGRYMADHGEFDSVAKTVVDRELWVVQQSAAPSEPTRFQRTSASGLVLDIRTNPLPNGGFVRTMTDITELKQAEEAVRESDERYALVMQSIDEIIYDCRLDTGEIDYQSGNKETFGLPDRAASADTWMSRVHEDDLPLQQAAQTALFKGETDRLVCEYRVRDVEDQWRWVRQSGIVLRHDDGTAYRFVGSTGDITERKRAEEALRVSEARYQAIAANVPGAVYQRILHADGRLEYAYMSPGIKDLFGFDAETVRTNPAAVIEVVDPGTREAFNASLTQSAKTLSDWSFDFSVTLADGTHKWVRSTAGVRRDEDGSTIWDGFIFDISDRKRAEQAMAESEKNLTAMMASSPIGASIVGSDSIIKFTNSRMGELVGRPAEELIGAPASISYASPEQRMDLLAVYEQDGQVRDHETLFQRADGSTFWALVSLYPTEYRGEPALIGWAYDITEKKETEETLEAARAEAEAGNRAKSEFVANMSHELRTPLNAIIGYSEILVEDAEEQNVLEFVPDLQKISGAGRHLLMLINGILDLSKIEAGKMDIFLEEFDIASTVEDVKAVVQPLIDANRNSIRLNIGKNLGSMYSDQTKVRQNLINLLSNASKFTDRGRITLTASRVRRSGKAGESKEDWIKFRIRDTGIGMTEDQTERLFQAFTQADSSTTRNYGGTGLGLTITRHFCDMLGGEVEVESVLGEGSVFTLYLPAKSAAEDGIDAGDYVTIIDPAASAPIKTVLAIDDDRSIHKFLDEALVHEGYRVIHALGGEEGLRLAREVRPDVITLDIIMPKDDGWTVLSQLKNDADLKRIPVVLLTVLGDAEMGYALGAADYLTKPIDSDALLDALARHTHPDGPASILVVDDDPSTRNMLRRTLEREGLPVRLAGDGKEALEQIKEMAPTLILLDLLMPVKDGFDVMAELQNNPDWSQIPVVIITAKDLTSDEIRMLDGKVEKIFKKGAYDRRALLEMVRARVTESVTR